MMKETSPMNQQLVGLQSLPKAPTAIHGFDEVTGVFSDSATVRAELRRLFRWLKGRGVTAVITGERGEGTLTRHGIEEYVSDCVIVLDHRVNEQTSTRRLRGADLLRHGASSGHVSGRRRLRHQAGAPVTAS